jgi:hypothetical protein
LGGEPGKRGTVSKNTLIYIIISEFELSIDMEVRKTIYNSNLCLTGVLEENRRRKRRD